MCTVLRPFLLGIAAGAVLAVHGQCAGSIDLGPDIALCTGQNTVLSVAPGYLSYQWSTGASTPTITVTAPGTYSCTVTEISTGGSVIDNGDFSAGSAGFTSGYAQGTGGPWGLVSLPGTYAITTSPNIVHSNFSAFGDHTTGTGNMLVVNGAETAGQNVWCQQVTVLPNTTYAFSAWLASAYFESPALLSFTVDGVAIGTLNASNITGQWLNYYSLWTSGSTTSVNVCISNLNTSGSGNDFAIDDIAFVPFCTYTDQVLVNYFTYPQPDLGPDVSFCADAPVTLDPQWPSADAYAWQNGNTTATLTPSSSGILWVDVTENGCTARDSITVTVLPLPSVDLGSDAQRCDGDVVVLDAGFPGASVVWNDGSTDPLRTVIGSGTFGVTLDLAGCTDQDTVSFTYYPLPVVELGNDTSICATDQLVFDVARDGATYLWQDGSTLPQLTANAAGVYWVAVEENACTTRDSLVLGTIALPAVDLGPDRLLCVGATEELDAEGPDYTYSWDGGSTAPVLVIDGPGMYTVTVTNSCGEATDAVEIDQDYCDCPVYVPNAFTQNNDGINDTFLPRFDCPVRSYTLRIFDRWGAEQWVSTEPGTAWDGGGLAPGLYNWVLDMEPDTELVSGARQVRGHVVLLR